MGEWSESRENARASGEACPNNRFIAAIIYIKKSQIVAAQERRG